MDKVRSVPAEARREEAMQHRMYLGNVTVPFLAMELRRTFAARTTMHAAAIST
ncbi:MULTISPECIES: hypothetical protein [unclassified Variovorax]|jgi:hypothetical protein|uniref:hypothetical protein n=1 Tax=Variovorax TaxID=34072 RepID=UPI001ABD419A|nr:MULTISPECIES: hypothetical protein [unclassified Variovorax]MCT8176435.1 hypothetical protein [Variovorax sp. CY25R-8]